MEKITIEKINNFEKKSYMIITTFAIYAFITIFKHLYFNLYNVSFTTLTNIEQLIATITYQIFAISISIMFLIKNKNKTLEQFKNYIKIALIGLITIIIYNATTFLELATLYYTKVDVSKMTITTKTIYLISFEVLIMAIIALINHKKLEKNAIDIKKNYNEYFKEYLKIYILALIIMMISNLIINTLTQEIAGNEQAIRDTFSKAPIYMFFSAVIFAPFAEEMVFRQSIRNIIEDKKIFVIVSGLIFGGLHVIGNINNFYDILYIIPYATPGIAFAYMLEKTDNIFVPMGIHFLHNGLLMTLQIILLFLN